MDSVSVTIAANVRRIRMAKGLTLADTASTLEAMGHPIALSALSKLETRNRSVSAGDLVALALALEVGVIDLLNTETCPTCKQPLPVMT